MMLPLRIFKKPIYIVILLAGLMLFITASFYRTFKGANFQQFLIQTGNAVIAEVYVESKIITPTTNVIRTTQQLQNCSRGENLVGLLYVDKVAHAWQSMKQDLSFVQPGGKYSPQHCIPIVKTAIIIPYRNRDKHLRIFLKHIHPILKRQLLKYQIFVIEQDDDNEFNRGKLMNVGFNESLKINDFDCFIFHDVDLIPEDDRNYYGCHISPAHLSVAVDKFNYELLYEALFGGVVMFKKGDFTKVNGFSNKFWGWGAEDDNLSARIRQIGMPMRRPAIKIARYTMLKHLEAPKSDKRFAVLQNSYAGTNKDGLNSLRYKVKSTQNHEYYIKISVDLQKDADEKIR